MKLKYWTKGKGIGGKIKSPEDFVVREIIDKKFLRKYSIKKIIEEPEKYQLVLIRKRNITTKDAVRILSNFYKIPQSSFGSQSFGYAGLKDKFSVSFQYLTVKSKVEKINLGNIEVIEIRKTDKFLSPGDLIANEFEITLHGCSGSPEKAIEEIERCGMPNFFGPQRFGKHGNNHVIGKLLLKRKFDKALDLIDEKYKNLKDIPKDILKFYVHAYQSWLFNSALDEYVSKEKRPYFKEVKIPGYKTELGHNRIEKSMQKMLEKDKIKISDFMINELRMSSNGAKRAAFIKVKIRYEKINGTKLCFTLPKGSYATALLKEITK